MAKRITATEAARNFSELLNTVRFRRSRYTIVRGGKPIATLGPAEGPVQERSLGELRDLWARTPRLGDEAERLERDLRAARRRRPGLPRKTSWE